MIYIRAKIKTFLSQKQKQKQKAEVEILKYGLKHPVEPKHLLKTVILATFEQNNCCLLSDPKDESKCGKLKATISNLEKLYWSLYKGTRITLSKLNDVKAKTPKMADFCCAFGSKI